MLEHAARAFDPNVGANSEKAAQMTIDELYAKIGQLQWKMFFCSEVRKMSVSEQDDARSRPHLKECAELAPPYQDCRENPKRQRGTVLL